MNELIKITYNNDTPRVSGRELHEFLEVDTPYHKWFPRMCEYGFIENQDYAVTDIFVHNPSGGPQSQKDAALSVEMAKEISMLQRNDKGKQARQYFIQLEKAWNSPEQVMARALKLADRKIHQLEQVVLEQRPKVLFADAVETSSTSILVGDLAKLLKQNGTDVGQNRLFEQLRQEGYLCSRKGDQFNAPSQKAMDLGLFEVRERTINNPDGSVRITRTTKVTGRGQIYFINRYCGKSA